MRVLKTDDCFYVAGGDDGDGRDGGGHDGYSNDNGRIKEVTRNEKLTMTVELHGQPLN